MPTSSPIELTSAPPELPALIAASVWIILMRRQPQLATCGADDAHRHRFPDADRIANGQHHVSNTTRPLSSATGIVGRSADRFSTRQVGFRIAAHDRGGGVRPSSIITWMSSAPLNHVVVGQHIAIPTEDDAGTGFWSVLYRSDGDRAKQPSGQGVAAPACGRR